MIWKIRLLEDRKKWNKEKVSFIVVSDLKWAENSEKMF